MALHYERGYILPVSFGRPHDANEGKTRQMHDFKINANYVNSYFSVGHIL